MAAILDNLSFSSSFSLQNLDTHERNSPKIVRFHRFRIEMLKRESKSPMKSGINGKPNGKPLNMDRIPIAMVPITEAMKKMTQPEKRPGILTRFTQIDNRETTSAIEVKKPSIEGSNILPSDETFSWANENYNPVQRTLDLCSFVISLHLRLLLNNSKWSYPRGFTEIKQV